jgi:hypothetical protein
MELIDLFLGYARGHPSELHIRKIIDRQKTSTPGPSWLCDLLVRTGFANKKGEDRLSKWINLL